MLRFDFILVIAYVFRNYEKEDSFSGFDSNCRILSDAAGTLQVLRVHHVVGRAIASSRRVLNGHSRTLI